MKLADGNMQGQLTTKEVVEELKRETEQINEDTVIQTETQYPASHKSSVDTILSGSPQDGGLSWGWLWIALLVAVVIYAWKR